MIKEIDIVAQKAKELNITTTKLQYVLISKIMAEKSLDISPEECMEVCNFQRYCRMVLDKDKFALEKEAEHHRSPALWTFENQTTAESKRLQKDRLLFS